MYSLEELERIFKENAIVAYKENECLLKEFQENNPGEPIPEWFTRDFCINTALAAMCREIQSLKEKC